MVLRSNSGTAHLAAAVDLLLHQPRTFVERRDLAPAWLRFAIGSYCAKLSQRHVMLGISLANFASRRHRRGRASGFLRDSAILWCRSAAAPGRLSRRRRNHSYRSTALNPGPRGFLRWIFALCGFSWRGPRGD